MRIDNKHTFWFIAIILVAMIAAYEGYWLWGLFQSQKRSLETQVSSLISKSELAAFSLQLKQEQLTDSVAFLSPDNMSKIVSIQRNAATDNKITSISIYKREDFNKKIAVSVAKPDFKEAMDSILSQNMKEAGLENMHFSLEIQDADSTAVDKRENIAVKSSLGKGVYLFDSSSVTGYVLRGMWGIILTSWVVVVIVMLALWFLIKVLKKQLELNEMKSNFTSNITHELKTPIAAAYAANDALLNYGLGDDPVKRKEYLNDTKEQLEKLGALVERILSVSMKERGNFKLDISETNLRDMLEKIAQETRLRASKDCDIQIETAEDLTAVFDASLMSSVISTLVDNAVKYSEDSVQIRMKAIRNSGKTVISVSDNGIGIGAEHQKHVFEKFYRVPHGDLHVIKGYGIGLYFAKTIVEKHGGRISLISTLGEGSTFTIEL